MDLERLLRIAQRVAAQKYKRDLKWWDDPCHDPSTEEAPQYWRKDIDQRWVRAVIDEKYSSTIKWHEPKSEDDRQELERAALALSIDIDTIMKKAASGWLGELSDFTWACLANSDSWKIESMEEAQFLASTYDLDLAPINVAIGNGLSLPAPIVLNLDDGTSYLASGNGKLMVARAMGVTPKVFFVDVFDSGTPAIPMNLVQMEHALEDQSG